MASRQLRPRSVNQILKLLCKNSAIVRIKSGICCEPNRNICCIAQKDCARANEIEHIDWSLQFRLYSNFLFFFFLILIFIFLYSKMERRKINENRN